MDFLPNKQAYLQPLSKVSLDDSKTVSLVDTDDILYNFDGIKKYLCKQLQRREEAASCDGLLERDGTYYFLEFKNQPSKKVDAAQLARKAFQSFHLFRLAFEQEMSVDESREHLVLLIIYQDSEDDVSFEKLRRKVHGLANMPERDPILFDLRRVHGKLYREIYTMPRSEFMADWYPRLFPNHK